MRQSHYERISFDYDYGSPCRRTDHTDSFTNINYYNCESFNFTQPVGVYCGWAEVLEDRAVADADERTYFELEVLTALPPHPDAGRVRFHPNKVDDPNFSVNRVVPACIAANVSNTCDAHSGAAVMHVLKYSCSGFHAHKVDEELARKFDR